MVTTVIVKIVIMLVVILVVKGFFSAMIVSVQLRTE